MAESTDVKSNPTAYKPAVGMTTRVVRGSFWTLTGQSVTILASLVATPFIIRLLGPESYGVLALINLLIGYLAFADLGMGTASTRFGADAHAHGDHEGESAVVWTSILIAFVPAVLGAIALALFAKPLVEQVLRLPTHLQAAAVLSLRLASAGFVFRTIASVLNTPQIVRLRMDLNSLITTTTSVLQFLLIPVVLVLGGGLVAAVSVMAAVNLALVFIHVTVSWTLVSGLLRPRIRSALIRPLMRFGGGLVISSLAAMLLVTAEKLLLTRLVSVSALAHYAVAFMVAGLLYLVPQAMIQSLLPALSQLQSESERSSRELLYIRALRGNLLWIAPVALLLCLGAKPFFTLWAGAEYGRESTIPFYILIGGMLFNVVASVPYTLLVSLGRSDLIARIHVAEVLPYLLCVTALIHWFGVIGAALAYTLRVIIDALLFYIAARRISGFSRLTVQFDLGVYAAAVATLSLPVLLAAEVGSSTATLIIVTIISLLVYAWLVWKLLLTSEERAWVSIAARLRGTVHNSA